MPIGQFSELSGISPKRLRTYAGLGLLCPSAVAADTGYRFYSEDQLVDARLIDALRRGGIPLAEISEILCHRSPEVLEPWKDRLQVEAERSRRAIGEAQELLVSGRTVRPVDEGKPRRKSMHLSSAARTHVGHVRPNNEDAVLATGNLLAVADGVGGHPAREVASALATDLLRATYTGRSLDELGVLVQAANWTVWNRASSSPELEGMATTLCALALLDDGTGIVTNAGDSRAYLVHEGSLTCLTADHTVAADLVRAGQILESEAELHPHRQVLTRVLGMEPAVEADSVPVVLVPGDRLVLTTDGLHNEVPRDELERLTTGFGSPETIADALINLVLAGRAVDNASVVLAEVHS